MPQEDEPVGAWRGSQRSGDGWDEGSECGRFMVSVTIQSPIFFVYTCCPVATPLF